jgi:hypothetical protein
MKRFLAAAAVVAIAGFFTWRVHDAPVQAYRAFAEEMVHHRFDRAAAMTDGLSADALSKSGGVDPAMMQTLFPSHFDVQSRQSAPDGTLTLHAVQTVLFNPPGVESAIRPVMYAKLNQTVSLRKSGGGWKIVAFDNRFDRMDSLTSR